MKWLMTLVFISHSAFAGSIENVSVLGAELLPTGVYVKMHAPVSGPGSYFFVNVNKSDPAGFDKLGLILQKVQSGSEMRLDLEIISFSLNPSGAVYSSESVKFHPKDSHLTQQSRKNLKSDIRSPAGK